MKRVTNTVVRFLSLLLLTAGFSLIFTGMAWATGHVADELLIRAEAGVSKGKVAEILGRLGADAVGEIAALQVKKIKVPAHALENVRTALANNPNISLVEYNFIAEISFTPDDELFPFQWHLPKILATSAWDISTGSNNVPIAIIDSGVDPAHPDLSGKILPGYNFLKENTNTNDVHGHGTMVAGSAAALSNNIIGVASIAWENPVMPLVVVNRTGWATYYNMARAITYAADNGIKVINMSLAGSSSSYTLQDAVNYAWDMGAVIFAAAGNSSSISPYYPAACDNVVAVSATDPSDSPASFSNRGNWIDISAPGVSILTTSKGGGYSSPNGTSFSSPISAGLASLILSVDPYLTNTEVVDIMKQNADDLGDPGFDAYFGYGRINIYSSLVAAGGTIPDPDTTVPSAALTYPVNGSTVSGDISVSVSAEDNIAVSDVELYINGTLFETDTVEPYSFLWSTGDYPDGGYELLAIAYDISGNAGQSDSVTVYVSNPTMEDTIAPEVSIISPGDNSRVKRNTLIKAAATDNVGVNMVEFYINDVLRAIKYATSDTYSWKWDTRSESKGEHSITVKAYDEAGNQGVDHITVFK